MVKILYVEDEPFLGKIVKETLESKGFDVYMETDGNKVLGLYKTVQPDICVLDIMLPNKDGFEIAEGIKQQNPQMPVLFLTAKSNTTDVLQGFAIGANDYLKKPFSMEELIARIGNLLNLTGKTNKQEQNDAEHFSFGKYTFNVSRQVLSGFGENRKLSYREAELLRYLFKNRNEIIDRRDLLNAIWGNDSYFNSRNLDVYITKLRGYIKEDTELEILTIKGIGYRFVT
ncbi:response regulator transcription factor [Polluticaenibacter yanchengensis]|uniref:Response regulator transcription factor n=1 Tax=Polluticaenibacter yanchengensis TaxID=3014562 RepID=A0ABT4UJP3_9BACT|nr:response regulator transcription factor [Chitinophagaceae bacterium LY-5]